jgi:molybdopterin synthase catalytic subunit/molybdopterin converting factor small subunit
VEVVVRLFAGLREAAGRSEAVLDLRDGATVGDVWPELGLGPEPDAVAYAVNRRYADRTTPLADGDEVALIPPVSGGGIDELSTPRAELVSEPLDLGRLLSRVADPAAGGIATFVGTVRDTARGRRVLWLEYEAYDAMALEEMDRIAGEVCDQTGALRCLIAHRVGRLEVGEAAVAVVVAAAHRGAALDACRQAIDTLKETVPIWKKERYEDGEEWIGQGS